MEHEQPNFSGVPLDRTTVAQELLNIDNKQRSNLFPWNGQFSPQLVEVLLRTYSPMKGLVLDPFVGSGTVLYEAGRVGLPVVGAEVNPAACKMAETYRLMNVSFAHRSSLMKQLEGALQECLPACTPSLFWANGRATDEEVKTSLVELCDSQSDETARCVLEALIVLVDFYHEATDEKVYGTWAKLKARILGLPESDCAGPAPELRRAGFHSMTAKPTSWSRRRLTSTCLTTISNIAGPWRRLAGICSPWPGRKSAPTGSIGRIAS